MLKKLYNPNESDESELMVYTRVMDYDKLKLIRKRQNRPDIGKEDDAIVSYIPKKEEGVRISYYRTDKLEEILKDNIEEFKHKDSKSSWDARSFKVGKFGFYNRYA